MPYARQKVARYYLGEPSGEDVLPISPELGRPEHHEFRWVSFDEAEEPVAAAAGGRARSRATIKQSHKLSARKRHGHTTTPSGLMIEEVVVGTGAEATAGQQVTVHYTGWLTDGTRSSIRARTAASRSSSRSARGQVIKGWDEGVQGMKVGGKRKLTIPPELGYGARGAGGVIPPNATLVFEVELLGVG